MEDELTMPELIKNALDPAKELGGLEYKELCPALLGEYFRCAEKLKDMEKIKDMLHAEIVGFAKERRGALQYGGYTLVLKDRRGNVTVDWPKYVTEMLGEKEFKELEEIKKLVKDRKADSIYCKLGKDTVTVEVIETETAPEY